MMNQEQRLQDFKVNADQVEAEANSRNKSEAIQLLRKGYTPRIVANKCFMAIKEVQELQARIF